MMSNILQLSLLFLIYSRFVNFKINYKGPWYLISRLAFDEVWVLNIEYCWAFFISFFQLVKTEKIGFVTLAKKNLVSWKKYKIYNQSSSNPNQLMICQGHKFYFNIRGKWINLGNNFSACFSYFLKLRKNCFTWWIQNQFCHKCY